MSETNPLLLQTDLPRFSAIRPEHVEPAIETILADNRRALERLLASGGPWTWDGLVKPIEDLEDRLEKAWSPVRHLNAVADSPALRDAFKTCLDRLTRYETELGQNRALFEAYRALLDRAEEDGLDAGQRKLLEDRLHDFRLKGVDLADGSRARYAEIQQRLASLQAIFAENLLDATAQWCLPVEDEARLDGLGESDRQRAAAEAKSRGLPGWALTLDPPSYLAVMDKANDREIRRRVYEAFMTRASDAGPDAGRWDNGPIMTEILALRHEGAGLLGYRDFTEQSLATKMADDVDTVFRFLDDLVERVRPAAAREFEELRAFARDEFGLAEPAPWDIPWASERLREHRYELSAEAVREYFPADRAVAGMFRLVDRLYGLRLEEDPGADTWHGDVRFFDIFDGAGEHRGRLYMDLFARREKQGGAWMDECVTRRRRDDVVQVPAAYLCCNFPPPGRDHPSLLSHEEVLTLLHEFGHCLHHLLTRVDHLRISGINGVEWDAVELPSQFHENFGWDREVLSWLSGHWQTGETLPESMFRRMEQARNFQSAMHMTRQLELSLIDLRLHYEYDGDRGIDPEAVIDDVRRRVRVTPVAPFDRFANGFAHIFGGDYAAGYYSYLWAEVLSADAFSAFEEAGVLDGETGRRFRDNILERGGSRPAGELFRAFRGREPRIDAFLRHRGVETT